MIKLFLSDCDGTLTDGIYHTTEKGEISKNFFTRDFHGFWMLNKTGVKIGIITAAADNVIDHQCRRGARYVDVVKGTRDKFASIEDKYVTSGLRFKWDEIAYIGDDVFDSSLLQACGIAACPADADQSIFELVGNLSDGFASDFSGGKGCVREFAEHVLRINEIGRQ